MNYGPNYTDPEKLGLFPMSMPVLVLFGERAHWRGYAEGLEMAVDSLREEAEHWRKLALENWPKRRKKK